jgi:hypothetical protein
VCVVDVQLFEKDFIWMHQRYFNNESPTRVCSCVQSELRTASGALDIDTALSSDTDNALK